MIVTTTREISALREGLGTPRMPSTRSCSGSVAQAQAQIDHVRGVFGRVHGRITGIEPLSGLPYRADDIEHLRYVHVTTYHLPSRPGPTTSPTCC
ncbi:hypothetical protein BH23ACT9_BH23ACT9_25760 [soil metagenome]